MKTLIFGKPLNGARASDLTRRPHITQLFGENANSFYKKWGLNGHNGIDYRTKHYDKGHAPIFAVHDGYVISDKTTQSDTKGRFVILRSKEILVDGKPAKIETVYFHLSEALASFDDKESLTWYKRWFGKNGNYIKQGQIIGIGGNTGKYTTGAHLHLGLYVYWKQKDGSFKKNTTNGYGGAIDPMRFFGDNIVYQYGSRWFFNGKETSKERAKKLITKNN